MQNLFLDFETYYDNDYSLSKMTTAAYVMDDRFLSRGASVAINDQPAQWLTDDKLRSFFDTIDWDNTRVIAHNTLFDGYVLVHRYDRRPAEWCDTVSLVNYIFDWASASLKNTASRMGLQDKGDALEATKGKVDLSDEEQQNLDAYAIGDVEICRDIYNALIAHMPPEELKAIDMTVDMMVYPRWMADGAALIEYADRLATEKEIRLAANSATIREYLSGEAAVWFDANGVGTFASAPKFKTLLNMLGLEIPTKLIKATASKVKTVEASREKALKRIATITTAMDTMRTMIRDRQAQYDQRNNKDTKVAKTDLRVIEGYKKRLLVARCTRMKLRHVTIAKRLRPGQLIRVPALAKTDEGLLELMGVSDVARAAVEARLDAMSNINETRARTLAATAAATGGFIPTPLRYCGAHTNRHSGREYNLQNLPSRGDTTIRRMLTPPPGYKLVVADLSQIEPRMLGFLADCKGYKAAFKPDGSSLIYETAAAGMYKIPVEEVTKAQRQMGKVSVLGQGYGMGWRKFISYAKTTAKVELTDDEAKAAVAAYRGTFHEIPDFWKLCDEMLPNMARFKGFNYVHNGIQFRHEAVILPSGRFLRYDNLQQREITELDEEGEVVDRRMQWVYGDFAGTFHGIYGGLFVENLVQATSRDVIVDMALLIRDNVLSKQLGELIVNLVHDEVVCVVREDRAEEVATKIKDIMSTTPSYMEGMPLSCTVSIANNYAEAK